MLRRVLELRPVSLRRLLEPALFFQEFGPVIVEVAELGVDGQGGGDVLLGRGEVVADDMIAAMALWGAMSLL
jgi:hypothetical protein